MHHLLFAAICVVAPSPATIAGFQAATAFKRSSK